MKIRFILFLLFWSVCAELTSSWEGESAGQSQFSRSHSSGGAQRDPSRSPFTGRYDYRGMSQEDLVSGHDQCKVSHIFKSSIPSGQTEVDYITVHKDISVKTCIDQCCKLGAQLCQYAWLFTEQCILVGCSQQNATKCLPLNMPTLQDTSTYVSLQYPYPDNIPYAAATTFLPTELEVPSSITPPPGITTPPLATATPPLTTATPPLTTTTPSLTTTTLPPSPHTVTAPTSSAPPANEFIISFAGDRNLTLPKNSTQIFTSTWPGPDPDHKFLYTWEKVSGPSQGTISGIDKDTVTLSGLVAGDYVLKLTVDNWKGKQEGVATVNVTVHQPPRNNTPPVPVISLSTHTTVVLPHNSALFDASGSYDDMPFEGLRFQWDEVEGPVGTQFHSDRPVIQLNDLRQGYYKYKLTVTDADGASGVTFATVTVNPEMYYPPQASAGRDQLIFLPNNHVILDGSRSTAFKGELLYSWEKLLGPGSVDMKGTNSPYLELYRISSTGDYLFQLTVTDSRGQTSSSNVSLVVLPEDNHPPVADAGPDLIVVYPHTTALLNGNASTDDFRIEGWLWTQLSGPTVVLRGVNTSILEVEGLHIDEDVGSPTSYQFQLSVWDHHNTTNTSDVTIVFRKDPKIPPHVSAGGHVNITLPQNTIVLNGSRSYDDFGISSYQWVRSKTSPAAGLVMDGSDHQPVLIMSGLVGGTYNFTLTVTSRQGVEASDGVIVHVLPNPVMEYLLLVQLEMEPSVFSIAKQRQLVRVLSLILDDIDVDYDIIVEEVHAFGSYVSVEFYAVRRDDHTPLNATVAYEKLTAMGQDYHYPNSNFHFIKIAMKVCQLPCSGHGSCDQKTHKCSCSRYWMENPIKARFGKEITNCEWSIFYVSLALVLSVAVVLFVVWLSCYCCMRKRRIARTKRRVRYAVMDRKGRGEEKRRMLPRDRISYQESSLMVSGTETEEEILFQSKTDLNGTFPSPSNIHIRTSQNPSPEGSGQAHSTT